MQYFFTCFIHKEQWEILHRDLQCLQQILPTVPVLTFFACWCQQLITNCWPPFLQMTLSAVFQFSDFWTSQSYFPCDKLRYQDENKTGLEDDVVYRGCFDLTRFRQSLWRILSSSISFLKASISYFNLQFLLTGILRSGGSEKEQWSWSTVGVHSICYSSAGWSGSGLFTRPHTLGLGSWIE